MIRNAIIFTLAMSAILSLTANVFAFKLPDSGQTKCYQSVSPYAEIDCAGTGQDGAYSYNPLSYTDNGDGTVTDNNTGLIWQKCSVGQTNDANCSGAAIYYNWYQASGTFHATYNPSNVNICGTLDLGGHNDWRLPLKRELSLLMDYSVAGPSPTIKSASFPNSISAAYWSSTGFANGPDFAWYVAYYAGGVYSGDKSNSNYLRCVRSGPSPVQSFTDNGNGTVTDLNTGLTWQKENYAASNWGAALSACETSSLANHTDWRLPNVEELKTLIDDSRSDPAIDTSFFPNVSYYYYWTSTTRTGDAGQGFLVGFGSGNVLVGDKGNDYYAMCVRGVPGVLPARIGGSYYSTLQEAYDAAHDGDTIEAMATSFTMDLTVGKQITIKGGFDGTFSSNSGYTTLDGSLTIQDGSLVAANIVLL